MMSALLTPTPGSVTAVCRHPPVARWKRSRGLAVRASSGAASKVKLGDSDLQVSGKVLEVFLVCAPFQVRHVDKLGT